MANTISSATLEAFNQGLKTQFALGVENAGNIHKEFTQEIQSTGTGENYMWIKQLPVVKEFLTQRVIQNTNTDSFYVPHKNFESTIDVLYTDLQDDNIGRYSMFAAATGESMAFLPRTLAFNAIRSGLTSNGIDGVPFFSATHPTYNSAGVETTFSNITLGAGNGWVVLDNSRSYMRPIVVQMREAPRVNFAGGVFDDRGNFMAMSTPFGGWARMNAAAVLPHLAHASFVALTEANVYAVLEEMQSIRKSDGTFANIQPTHILVPPSLRQEAEALFNVTQGDTNPLYRSLKIIVAPELTGWDAGI